MGSWRCRCCLLLPRSGRRNRIYHATPSVGATRLPLAAVVATASVFYYPWANELVYRLAGDTPRSQQTRGSATGATIGTEATEA